MLEFLQQFAAKGGDCVRGAEFLGFPTWYKYLEVNNVRDCVPGISSLSDIWLIVAAIVEILLRIAAITAVVFVIVGAVQLITGEGEPEKVAKARGTIVNALVGLVIAVIATAVVTYIAGKF